ncbi:MAG TPA: heavy-metal-associated domain-containing protein [Bryobacteraceae bacterium]|jgi:copper chaperone CopZ|nr:heavy-metal-associated domain-containing protein [Bryobacteraceae bacterium]
MSELNIKVEGMHCGACVRRLTLALNRVEGVEAKQVDVGSATITYDPEKTSDSEIKRAVENAGFRVGA